MQRHLEQNRLFAGDEAEREFRRGLESAGERASGAGGPGRIHPLVFDGIDPFRVGEALACLVSGTPVLLAAQSWGSWTWREVDRLSRIPLNAGSVVLRTGGSTGEAKFAVHTWESLNCSAEQGWRHFQKQPLSTVLDLPLHHVSGWMPVLRALVSGGLLSLPGEQADLPGLLCRSVVPTTLYRNLRDKDKSNALKKADRVFAGGALFDPALLDRARREKIRLSLVYGMTETAAMVALQEAEDFLEGKPPTLKPFGKNEVELAEDGEILIRSPQLFEGYWGRDPVPKEEGWWQTGDRGEETGEGEFRPLGRKGRFADAGGETVSLGRIEGAVSEISGVEDFWLGVLPDEEWGSRLILFVVSSTERDWKAELKGRLDPGEVPAEIRVVESIPRGTTGKIDPDRLFG